MGINKASIGVNSVGIKAASTGLIIKKKNESDKIVALAGNPNVGKSTVFNELTGLKQHTGNWPGKTVTNAQGYCEYKNQGYVLVDLPGCYSLMAHSAEEEVARDFICFEKPDAVIVVCDATCLERNLNLVLQTLEITQKVVVCVNLLDEAKKKKIDVNLKVLSQKLGVPVVGASARSGEGLGELMQAVSEVFVTPQNHNAEKIKIQYPSYLENAIALLKPVVSSQFNETIDSRWLSIKILEADNSFVDSINKNTNFDIFNNEHILKITSQFKSTLIEKNISEQKLKDDIAAGLINTAEEICSGVVTHRNKFYNFSDRKLDNIIASKKIGFPLMFIMLLAIFWITLSGANYPSQLLSKFLFWIEGHLLNFFIAIGTPKFVYEMLVLGVYRVLAWVVSVMLPPMAIFFPLFTLLEDVGYLPRVAFNLDKIYKKCNACGKQALTMCMGFGCNAVGVTGCRIIDSPRERLIAIITNNFVPCNGRFPTLIALITMFFVGTSTGLLQSLYSAVLLTAIIILGIAMTFIVSKLLSKTILKGVPSSFTLELPPYRKPQIGKVIIRSIRDRTLFVLGRAVSVAAPAGLLIWLFANITVNDMSVLSHCANFLNPFAKLIGMDGVILFAFILGLPANEIVIPIIIMSYMANGNIVQIENLSVLKQLLVDNGWTWVTAVSVMLFSLMHWPCSTTCLTIKKETESWKWTAVSIVVPTVIGVVVCFAFSNIADLILSMFG